MGDESAIKVFICKQLYDCDDYDDALKRMGGGMEIKNEKLNFENNIKYMRKVKQNKTKRKR